MNIAQIINSKNEWRRKAVKRSNELKESKRQKKLWKERAVAGRKEIQELKAQLSSTQSKPAAVPVKIEISMRTIAVMMFLIGVISCRAVVRMIGFVNSTWDLKLGKAPHPSSVVNWVCRAGLGALESVALLPRPWIAIIDMSISYARHKILVVLRVPADHFDKNPGRALSLEDTECIGIVIREVWNGDSVAESLAEVFEKSGVPKAIMLDGGSDLNSGIRKWKDKTASKTLVIRDIGHVVANLLKHLYSQNRVMKKFQKITARISKRLYATELAFLKPPKMRTKGRYQSISRVVTWAHDLTEILGMRGRAPENSRLARLRDIFGNLCKLRSFFSRVKRDCDVSNQVMQILKNEGLNQTTFQSCMKLAERLPQKTLRKGLEKWLRKHIRTHCRLSQGQQPLPVSTDIIESLFGQAKHIIERNPTLEFGSMVLAIPLLCGKQNEKTIFEHHQKCPHKNLIEWRKNNTNHTMRKEKCKFKRDFLEKESSKPVGSKAAQGP